MDSLKLNRIIKTPIDGDLGNVYEYIKNNFGSIMLVVIGFFLVMAYTSINNINFEKNEKELDKKFIIETFLENNKNMNSKSSLGEKSKMLKTKQKITNSNCSGKLDVIDSTCKKHKYKLSCTSYDCCNWGKRDNKLQCVGGGKDGPTFGSKKFDYYYYKDKKIMGKK
ncbi:MAG: hypothetical protein CML42_07610 [Rhodobacteraceae bacterium]|nr:hypothetical protein [Paracoccaceae bacterium]|tara:strand:+ start:3850 stop:4350 length:501 start_codon:yes stop_codon:yes gene_type:complete